MATIVGTLATLDDVLAESTDGQYVEVDLIDANGVPINTAAIVSLVGTLRGLDTGEAIFEETDLVGTGRASYPGAPGQVRITFPVTDLIALGSRTLQRRRLTLTITYSGALVFRCAVVFLLQNLGDV